MSRVMNSRLQFIVNNNIGKQRNNTARNEGNQVNNLGDKNAQQSSFLVSETLHLINTLLLFQNNFFLDKRRIFSTNKQCIGKF